MKFTKMEGIGNDYIYVDGISQEVSLDPAYITRLSDRHFGIGSDGMIVILPSDCADFKMRIFNADGSEAKMCGNGIRCFAKFCYDHHLTDKQEILVETLSGIKSVRLLTENEHVTGARVQMGAASLMDDGQDHVVAIHQQCYRYRLLSMGNPHAVVFVDDLSLNVNQLGDIISRDTQVDGGVNVEFVQVINRHEIKVRVYERGSQETMACGTGACASVAECCLKQLTDCEVTVHLLGGDLNILYRPEEIIMEGPARTVFEGEVEE